MARWSIVGSIKTRKDKDGYLIVGLTNLNGTLTTARVHRMVAETFIPNPSNCPVVNHKDNIKTTMMYQIWSG